MRRYGGCQQQSLSRIGLPSLAIEWSVPADNFRVDRVVGDVLTLWHTRGAYRGLRCASGDVAWTIETPKGSYVWRDRVLVAGTPARLLSPATGEVKAEIPMPDELLKRGGFVVGGGR